MLQVRKAEEPLQQGDIVRGVPFLLLPAAVHVKAEGVQGQVRLDSQNPTSLENVQNHGKNKTRSVSGIPLLLDLGLIITQTCDLEHKPHVTLARVFPLENLVAEVREATVYEEPLVLYDVIRTLTEGLQYTHLVYLAAPDGTNRLAADLLQVQTLEPSWKAYLRQHRWMGMNEEGIKYFQGRLNLFTGRYALETGFWRMPDEHGLAEQVENNPAAVEEAYSRLEEKRDHSKE